MIDCIIMGDSIAVGTHQFRKECVSYSKGGITSKGWDKLFGKNDLIANTTIISLGTNDSGDYDTFSKLMEIRNKIQSKKVFWIMPNLETREKAYSNVVVVAKLFNDEIIIPIKYQKDKIHPNLSEYKDIAKNTK
ncbi:MAG: hypothetical protein EBU90_31680 [Proteobacteria bacterium]|nr:hypothetical protein [Pseudomonadota bacterium]